MSMLTGSPIIYGEVLFDAFPDGSEVLGGAPFNVAWHLQGFGCQPLFISCVGEDDRGKMVQEAMQRWGLSTEGIQIDREHPTGVVTIELTDGQPSFTIVPDQAYDFIDVDLASNAISAVSPALLYFGSLINRSPQSRNTLSSLRAKGIASFVDINLRSPWWDLPLLDELLSATRWLKLNDAEVEELCQQKLNNLDELQTAAQELATHYKLELLIVTMGAEGAFLIANNDVFSSPPAQVTNLVDTVGAGDAFASVILLGLLKQWPMEDTLKRAIEFAASLCEVRGATVIDKDFYKRHLERWE